MGAGEDGAYRRRALAAWRRYHVPSARAADCTNVYALGRQARTRRCAGGPRPTGRSAASREQPASRPSARPAACRARRRRAAAAALRRAPPRRTRRRARRGAALVVPRRTACARARHRSRAARLGRAAPHCGRLASRPCTVATAVGLRSTLAYAPSPKVVGQQRGDVEALMTPSPTTRQSARRLAPEQHGGWVLAAARARWYSPARRGGLASRHSGAAGRRATSHQ